MTTSVHGMKRMSRGRSGLRTRDQGTEIRYHSTKPTSPPQESVDRVVQDQDCGGRGVSPLRAIPVPWSSVDSPGPTQSSP